MDPDPAASDMFEYLTVNSTSLDTNGNTISDVLSVIQNQTSYNKQRMQRFGKVWMHWFYLLHCFSELPMDCSELFNKGETKSGIYVIKPNQSEPFNVYCEMGSG